jgi:DNA polymerase III subunit alpha
VREENGPYQGFLDLIERVNLQMINRKVLESLIKVGAFDQCEKYNRKTLLDNLDMMMAYAAKRQEEREGGQVSLFEMEGVQEKDKSLNIIQVADFDPKEKLQYEAELIGIYVSGHPLGSYGDIMKQMASMEISKVHELSGSDKRDITLAGLITSAKTHICKSGDKMCFATLEDLTGKIECIVFPKTYKECASFLESSDPVLIYGQVNLAEEPRKFFPTKMQKLKEGVEERVSGVRIVVDLKKVNKADIDRFKEIVLGHRGTVPIHLVFEDDLGRARMPLNDEFLVNPGPQMAAQINELFKMNSVKFIVDGRAQEVPN